MCFTSMDVTAALSIHRSDAGNRMHLHLLLSLDWCGVCTQVHLCWNGTAKGQAEVEEALHLNRLNAVSLVYCNGCFVANLYPPLSSLLGGTISSIFYLL